MQGWVHVVVFFVYLCMTPFQWAKIYFLKFCLCQLMVLFKIVILFHLFFSIIWNGRVNEWTILYTTINHTLPFAALAFYSMNKILILSRLLLQTVSLQSGRHTTQRAIASISVSFVLSGPLAKFLCASLASPPFQMNGGDFGYKHLGEGAKLLKAQREWNCSGEIGFLPL